MYLGAYVPREGNQQIITNIRIKKNHPTSPLPQVETNSVLGLCPRSGRLRRTFAWFVGGVLLVSSHRIPSKHVCL